MQKSSKMPRQVKAHAGVEPADPCVLRRLYPVEQLTLWWVSGTEDMIFMFPLLEVGAYCGLRGEREWITQAVIGLKSVRVLLLTIV